MSLVPLLQLAPLSPMDRHNRHLLHCRHWHHCPHWRNWCHCRKRITIVAIVVNGATGSIGAIGSPNDPLTLNGDCEQSIAIEWIKWRHLNGANGRLWRLPLAPMNVANGDCDRHWRHSPNHHWRQWSIHWRHLLSPLTPMAPNDPFTKLNDTFTNMSFDP